MHSDKFTDTFKVIYPNKLIRRISKQKALKQYVNDFFFDVLHINHEEYLQPDLSGRWDNKELVLKTGTKVEHLLKKILT